MDYENPCLDAHTDVFWTSVPSKEATAKCGPPNTDNMISCRTVLFYFITGQHMQTSFISAVMNKLLKCNYEKKVVVYLMQSMFPLKIVEACKFQSGATSLHDLPAIVRSSVHFCEVLRDRRTKERIRIIIKEEVVTIL
jgi:hypothetical protein